VSVVLGGFADEGSHVSGSRYWPVVTTTRFGPCWALPSSPRTRDSITDYHRRTPRRRSQQEFGVRSFFVVLQSRSRHAFDQLSPGVERFESTSASARVDAFRAVTTIRARSLSSRRSPVFVGTAAAKRTLFEHVLERLPVLGGLHGAHPDPSPYQRSMPTPEAVASWDQSDSRVSLMA